jgi:branched-chain amino acid transport system permease protein
LAARRNMKIAICRPEIRLIPSIGIVIVLAIFPVLGVPRVWLLYLFMFFVYLAMANMWNLLAGYSGLISLCPGAFVGLAGYTLAILTWLGWPYYIGMILGSIVAALFALLISFPVFRLKGIYFAIGTLVLPEVLRYVFIIWSPVGQPVYGGGAGYTVKGVADVSQAQMYWMALAIGIISIILMRYILRSKFGAGLAAVRDNDTTAASSGINVYKLKVFSFVISALVTGIAGTIFYVFQGYIEPASAFSVRWLVIIMLATVIGGEGIEEGPIVGTVVVVVLYFLLARYADISLIIQGVILVTIMLVAPQGIMGALRKTRIYHTLRKAAMGT